MQFRFIFMAIVVNCGLWACASGTSKEAVATAEKKVLDVHDSLMTKIGDVLKLNKVLRHRADSLDGLTGAGASATVRLDEEKQQIKQLRQQLNAADSLMMGWMDGYSPDTLQRLKPDRALDYLKQQQTKIDDVKQKINTSIGQAQTYLKK